MEAALSAVRRLLHRETANEFKLRTEEVIAKLRAEAAAISGKEHHKERAQIGRNISELRSQPRYIDACRVAKGLEPTHGYFVAEAASHGALQEQAPTISPDEAAKVAVEVEAALRELEPQQEEKPVVTELGVPGGRPEDADVQIRNWRRRIARLEATMAEPVEMPLETTDNMEELEEIAKEIVDFRQKLKDKCGYRNRDLKEYSDLQQVEDRLDVLAGALLPFDQPRPAIDVEGEELRHWEQRLTAKLAHHQGSQTAVGLKPSAAREVERLLTEVAELKAKLRAEGLTEHEQDKDEEVLTRTLRIRELQQFIHRDKKHDARERLVKAPELDAIREEIEQLRRSLETHKGRLREERGLSHKDIRQDPEISELEERLSTLQRMAAGA
eukprot:TRINITY_DN22790_c0_g1_i1.p1 TRINITY_DN22790_c0_g1~~TRINITY_DN22790_c0_g1_i1.p1  ORF type:complete len:403 (+),score=117.92 TRINITY_DN22790_c0_g1_i1:56-1210(+)